MRIVFGRSGAAVLRIHDGLSWLGYCLGSLALGLIVIIYSCEVVSRYFLGAPTRWASDFVSFLLLISVFLVVPWLTRGGGHVAVTIVPDQLSARVADIVLRIGFLVGALVCFYAGYISVLDNLELYDRGLRTLTTISIPKWPLTVFISYGLINTGLYFLRLTARSRDVD